MSKENLAGEHLDHVSLSGADLSEADLSRASLRRAHLEGAKLEKASLVASDLHGAYLLHADLTEADLRHADLTEADLRGVDLGRAAALDGARLAGAKGVPADVVAQAEQAADWVVSVRPTKDDDVRDEEPDDVTHVARALARAVGFAEADWDHTLTAHEREMYRRDARAAIAAVHEYERPAGAGDRHRRPLPPRDGAHAARAAGRWHAVPRQTRIDLTDA
jgi:uncharacterized protein YjbI with pentapeptide repeats